MITRPPGSTLTDTLLPYTTLCRSGALEPRQVQEDGLPVVTAVHHGGDAPPGGLRARRHRRHARARQGVGERGLPHVGPAGEGHQSRTENRRHAADGERSEEHTSELQSLMRISYAVFCLTNTN